MIQVLVCIFGEEPPVFARPQNQPAASSVSQPPYPPPATAASTGYTPYPTAGQSESLDLSSYVKKYTDTKIKDLKVAFLAQGDLV